MIAALIALIIYLLIAGLIWWAANTILAAIPGIPEPIKTVIYVIMVVIIVLIVIYALLGLLGTLGIPVRFPALR